MKKKEIMKEQKRLKEAQKEKLLDFSDKDDIKKVVYITIGVLLFIGLVFLVINLFNGTWSSYKRKNPIPAIDNSLVMCGTLFNKNVEEYLILAYNIQKEEDAIYSSMYEIYDGDIPLYYLDLESGFNKSCISDTNNLVSDSTKIKFASQTLLRIKNGKIVKSYTTKEQIKDYFVK